jgi:hypothetical protein
MVNEISKAYYKYKETTQTIKEEMQLVKLEVDHFSFEASKKNIDS